ncbi:hypothetical protein HZS_7253 [Henneguya salminicola]|nr:hypothetical protein HZS_7253 [Henneguya salminicola]
MSSIDFNVIECYPPDLIKSNGKRELLYPSAVIYNQLSFYPYFTTFCTLLRCVVQIDTPENKYFALEKLQLYAGKTPEPNNFIRVHSPVSPTEYVNKYFFTKLIQIMIPDIYSAPLFDNHINFSLCFKYVDSDKFVLLFMALHK